MGTGFRTQAYHEHKPWPWRFRPSNQLPHQERGGSVQPVAQQDAYGIVCRVRLIRHKNATYSPGLRDDNQPSVGKTLHEESGFCRLPRHFPRPVRQMQRVDDWDTASCLSRSCVWVARLTLNHPRAQCCCSGVCSRVKAVHRVSGKRAVHAPAQECVDRLTGYL